MLFHKRKECTCDKGYFTESGHKSEEEESRTREEGEEGEGKHAGTKNYYYYYIEETRKERTAYFFEGPLPVGVRLSSPRGGEKRTGNGFVVPLKWRARVLQTLAVAQNRKAVVVRQAEELLETSAWMRLRRDSIEVIWSRVAANDVG